MNSPPSTSFSLRRVVPAVLAVAIVGAGVAWYFGVLGGGVSRPPANSLMVISPYDYNGVWVFDDPQAGLQREPFVAGVPQMIDHLVADIPDAKQGFRLVFSAEAFPGYQEKLSWLRPEGGGNFYQLEEPPMEGWLCPALFKYFKEAPKELYVKSEPLR